MNTGAVQSCQAELQLRDREPLAGQSHSRTGRWCLMSSNYLGLLSYSQKLTGSASLSSFGEGGCAGLSDLICPALRPWLGPLPWAQVVPWAGAKSSVPSLILWKEAGPPSSAGSLLEEVCEFHSSKGGCDGCVFSGQIQLKLGLAF